MILLITEPSPRPLPLHIMARCAPVLKDCGVSQGPKCFLPLFPKHPNQKCMTSKPREMQPQDLQPQTKAPSGTPGQAGPGLARRGLAHLGPRPLGAPHTSPPPSAKGFASTRPAGPSQGANAHSFTPALPRQWGPPAPRLPPPQGAKVRRGRACTCLDDSGAS